MSPQRLTGTELTRVFNSARNEPSLVVALQRVQDAVLARNKLLPHEEVVALRELFQQTAEKKS